MKSAIELHSVQVDILVALLFRKQAKFSELNLANISNDHFSFHLRSLTKAGLVCKVDSFYKLTTSGKEFANRFDTDKKLLERQAKTGVLLCCIKKTKSGFIKYLAQQRLKEPYFGFWGFATGKTRWGETLKETAKRELVEETGLSGKLGLTGLKHKMDYDESGNLLEDKFFFVIKVTNTKGKLKRVFEGGKNKWLSENEILSLPNLFDGVKETIQMVRGKEITFSETKYQVNKY